MFGKKKKSFLLVKTYNLNYFIARQTSGQLRSDAFFKLCLNFFCCHRKENKIIRLSFLETNRSSLISSPFSPRLFWCINICFLSLYLLGLAVYLYHPKPKKKKYTEGKKKESLGLFFCLSVLIQKCVQFLSDNVRVIFHQRMV